MRPTEVLMEEHELIKRAIRLLEKADARLRGGDDAVVEAYPPLVDFIRHFADECHHEKEEDILFNALEEHGVPRENSPLGVMLDEHEQGRRFVRRLSAATDEFLNGNKGEREAIISNAEGYAELLKAHIFKEDRVLYPMADKVLPEPEQKRIGAQFNEIEAEAGPGRHQHYEKVIEQLETRLA